jgi:putative heme-binding domain-containing protein
MNRREPQPSPCRAALTVLTLLLAAPGVRADLPVTGPLSPKESLAKFKVGKGLAVDLVLSEPEITQPVFLNFDERGRMWVVEYRQYPEPAGLTMLSRDNVWRIVYDKVPLPPPRGVRGLDRISIHEDTDGDGTFDHHKTFVDGLNIATACARGRGGVWVLNPPYLLFYPDKDDDDVPDGDPEVKLEGFGLEDSHSVVNSLRWGPDGWLYAAQGSTVTGRVKRPGSDEPPVHSMGQLIWRYHPESRRYEIFAEGGGNAFGVEIDAKGRIFSGHNGGDTRGFHYVQGGYSRKGFDKHGPLSNPYAFGYFNAMKHPRVPRFTHTFLFYDDGALPHEYDGKLLGVAPLLSYVVSSEVTRDGSTFKTDDKGFPLTTTDPWFRPVDIKTGPDGAVYVADWYDGQTNHYRNHEGQIDRTNGRIYRLRAKDARPAARVDLAKKTTSELIDLLEDRANSWARQTALRLIGDRKDASAIPRLSTAIRTRTGQPALELLWALNLCGGLSEPLAVELLHHPDPYVRLWSVRLISDGGNLSIATAQALASLAKTEPDVEVRSQLACSSRRLPADKGLPIVRNLIDRDQDANDPQIPLLLWWAIEANAESHRETVLSLFKDREIWSRPIVRKFLAERIMRRYAASGNRADLLACAELLRLAPRKDDVARLMGGFEAAASGRSLSGLPDELVEAMATFSGGSVLLGLRQGKSQAVEEALKTLADDRADRGTQVRYIQALGEIDQPRGVPALLALATRSDDPALQGAALVALQRYKDPAIGEAIVGAFPQMTDDLRGPALTLLSSRPDRARRLLEAVDSGKLDSRLIPTEIVLRLLRYRDERLAALLKIHYGDVRPSTPAELQAEIDRLASKVRSGAGDPHAGEKLFAAKCASCHLIFGQGGKVGPDLTTYRRDELDTMLLNIVNPSAEIREGYGSVLVATIDGRALTGVLMDQDLRVIVLRGSDGRDVSIPRDQIEEMKLSLVSLMPEGLLKSLGDKDLRDLFAYLRSSQPPK